MKGKESTSNALAVQLDAEGKVKYDAIARQGHSKDKIVYSKLSDLLPVEVMSENDPSLDKPDQETIDEITESTRQALQKLTNSKIAAAMPVRCAEKQVSRFLLSLIELFKQKTCVLSILLVNTNLLFTIFLRAQHSSSVTRPRNKGQPLILALSSESSAW